MVNRQPFFSVITCTYNSQEFLSENIKSVESQELKNFEHIFIDAYSTDSTLAIIKEYQSRHPNQVSFYQHPPKGISNAMNLGIDHAQGQAILHLHSDDYLYSSKVLTQAKAVFDRTGADIVVGGCMFLSERGLEPIWPKNRLKRMMQKIFYRNFLFFTNGIPHPSAYIKKAVFSKYGLYSESLRNVMDYEFWFRVFKKVRVAFSDDIFSVYRAHANTASNLYSERAKAEIQTVFEQYGKDYRWERAVNAVWFKPLNRLFKSSGQSWL